MAWPMGPFGDDSWLPMGPLIQHFGEAGPLVLSTPLTARAADV